MPGPTWPIGYYVEPKTKLDDSITWTVFTRGTDAFDVAEVTVTYSYLAPQ